MALIERYEEREKKHIFGKSVPVNNWTPDNPDVVKERVSIWFNTLDVEKSIFSVVVTMELCCQNLVISGKTQTDFNVYPYANFHSIGGFNAKPFAEMMNIARTHCAELINSFRADVKIDTPIDEKSITFYLEYTEPIG